MNSFKPMFIVVILWSFFTIRSYGQGCSDAGFCTVNAFKPNNIENAEVLNNQVKIGAFLGRADNSIFVYGNYIEYNRQLSSKLGLDVKLITLAQNGNGIAVFGLSDVFLNLSYRASKKLNLTIGTKLPLSEANKTYNNLPLPMDYQASLGTFDLILGIGYQVKKFQIVAALQQPLTQNNNQFIAANNPLNSELRGFQSTNKFQRSGDVLLRVSYPITISPKFKMTTSILPIYHLNNDKYVDEFNIVREIEDSQGLTLNFNIYLDYEINNKNIIQVNVGRPFIIREARPDGLARSLVANLEYRINF